MRTLKYLLGAALMVAWLGGGAIAQESPRDAAAEELALVRAAVEAKLKIGDLHLRRGDVDAAQRAYEEAIEIYREAVARMEGRVRMRGQPGGVVVWPTQPVKPRVVLVPPEETVIETRIEDYTPAAIQRAVELGLKWLAEHQDEDGHWDSDGFAKHDPDDDKCDGAGGALYDVGATGLALVAFLGNGHTDRGAEETNPYADQVRAGLRFLLQRQDAEGCFGSRASQHFIYNHAMATLAVCEAYALTRNPRYKEPVQNGVNYILRARNPYLAWRYGARPGDNDTSVTGWCVHALATAKQAGFNVDPGAFEGARAWLDKVTDPEFGQVGYNMPGGSSARPAGLQDKFPPEKTQSMTASGILTRILIGEDPRNSVAIRKGADLCLALPPTWNADRGTIDMYYWYHGTMAFRRIGGVRWNRWQSSLVKALLANQFAAETGARTGSWDPMGPWGPDGGRIYATALMTLCLETCLNAKEG